MGLDRNVTGRKDTFPDEDTTQVITLGEGPRSTRPVPKRDRCTLTMLSGPTTGSLYTVADDEDLLVGRGSEASARVQDAGLSRLHARVWREAESYKIEDLGSTNGTYVNGRRLDDAQVLKEGDRIQMGGTVMFRVHLQDAVEQEATRRLYESAVRDALTQTHNRRYLDERLQAEFAFARRHLTPLSVLLIDLDHFKRINDTLGHLAGDAVLRVVATALQRMLRTEDVVARYGGEEFCVLARGTDARNAMIVGERIRRMVEGLQIPWEGKPVRVTLSVGVATMDETHPFGSVQALVGAADAALYRAKQAGRNRCAT
jgi:two-component system, cell cycle response regulator